MASAVFIYIFGVIVVGVIAKLRQRSFFLWVLVAFFITPLLASIIVLIIGKGQGKRINVASQAPETSQGRPASSKYK